MAIDDWAAAAIVRSLVVVAGCGDGIAVPDALVPDADDDRGVVEVRRLDHDPFRPSSVYFQDRDSTLSLATRLDENGRARGYLHRHGFVTVILHDLGGITRIFTYSNVAPGDELVIDQTFQAREGRAQLRLRVPAVAATELYTLESSCNVNDVSAATIMPIIVDLSGCGAQTDLLFVAHSPAGELFLFEDNVALSEAATLTLALTSSQYRAYDESTSTLVGVPEAANRWFVEKGIVLGRRVLLELGESVEVTDRTASLATLAPMAPGIIAITSATADSLETDTRGHESVIDWRPISPQMTIDLAAHDLRDQTAPAHYVPDESKIAWREDDNGMPAHVTVARMQWAAPDTLYQWTILGKRSPDATEARLDLPVLPGPQYVPDPRSPPYEMYRIATTDTAVINRLLGWTPSVRWPFGQDAGTVVWQPLLQQ